MPQDDRFVLAPCNVEYICNSKPAENQEKCHIIKSMTSPENIPKKIEYETYRPTNRRYNTFHRR